MPSVRMKQQTFLISEKMLNLAPFYDKIFISECFDQFKFLATFTVPNKCIKKLHQDVDSLIFDMKILSCKGTNRSNFFLQINCCLEHNSFKNAPN